MKFWKLVSVLGGETNAAEKVASTRDEWRQYGGWLQNLSQIVRSQDRDKLDHELPSDFVRENLKRSKISPFKSKDGTIRSRKTFIEDEEIDALEAYDQFGGDALEDTLEKGSLKP